MGKREGWNVTVGGECMITRRFRDNNEPEFLAVKEYLENSDVCYGHVEMAMGNFNDLCPARGNQIGTFLLGEPDIAKDMKWLGMDIVSLASNHSFDYGQEGIFSTIDACKKAGLAYAGIGSDLEEAREPGYLECAAGRVALISSSTGNPSHEWANLSKGSMKTRAGVNPINYKMNYVIPQEAADQLKEIGEKLKIIRQPTDKTPVPVNMESGEFRYFVPTENSTVSNYAFSVGDDYKVTTKCKTRDLEANLRSVREAKKVSDFVMVAHHATTYEYMAKKEPTGYSMEYAHAAIDEGADVFFGHGWHKTLGIEIYKGKPIFYGLGNLFAQSQFSRRVPYDGYDSWNHDIDRLPILNPSDEPLRPGMKPSQATTWWSSALIRLEYDENKEIKRIELVPVELGAYLSDEGAQFNRFTGKLVEGRPFIATGDTARIILERFNSTSKQYGTDIRIENGIGIWEA